MTEPEKVSKLCTCCNQYSLVYKPETNCPKCGKHYSLITSRSYETTAKKNYHVKTKTAGNTEKKKGHRQHRPPGIYKY